jgi:hypothetical protein
MNELFKQAHDILNNLEKQIAAAQNPATMNEQMETATQIRDGLHEMERWTNLVLKQIFTAKILQNDPFREH